MAETSSIEWTEATWNPITGCSLVSEGCRHCYAARLAATRLKHHSSRRGLARQNAAGEAKFTGELRFNEEWLTQPLRWKRPRMIFVCAHGDLFHESVPDEWIDRIFAVMALAPQHTFQVLTKRPKRMREYLADIRSIRRVYDIVCDMVTVDEVLAVLLAPGIEDPGLMPAWPRVHLGAWPLNHVWLGVSAEDQATADERIPDLLATAAAIRFVSAEPLLGPIDFTSITAGGDAEIDALRPLRWKEIWDTQWAPEVTGVDPEEALEGFLDWYGLSAMPEGFAHPALDQIIVGGESGANARPMHPDWARSIRDQCKAADVAFFFKQWGEHVGGEGEDSGDAIWFEAASAKRASRWLRATDDFDWFDPSLAPYGPMHLRLGKKHTGSLLDGVEHSEMPSPKDVPAL